eukprot:TRINITY_DN21524_c0_g1_i1.p1 TRINITY_DN21524_c0_g1~~TRINITY_DN21524_c0_g1_i1.p1  ORF type:complete len:126 (-),score=7.92 TRINITY_DN21524_c0_g1_i1:37-414(-)
MSHGQDRSSGVPMSSRPELVNHIESAAQEQTNPCAKEHEGLAECIRRHRTMQTKECYQRFDELNACEDRSYTPILTKPPVAAFVASMFPFLPSHVTRSPSYSHKTAAELFPSEMSAANPPTEQRT